MFKLSLRELLLLVTIAGIVTAWWLDHRRQLATIAERDDRVRLLDNDILKLGFDLSYKDSLIDGFAKEIMAMRGSSPWTGKPPADAAYASEWDNSK